MLFLILIAFNARFAKLCTPIQPEAVDRSRQSSHKNCSRRIVHSAVVWVQFTHTLSESKLEMVHGSTGPVNYSANLRHRFFLASTPRWKGALWLEGFQNMAGCSSCRRRGLLLHPEMISKVVPQTRQKSRSTYGIWDPCEHWMGVSIMNKSTQQMSTDRDLYIMTVASNSLLSRIEGTHGFLRYMKIYCARLVQFVRASCSYKFATIIQYCWQTKSNKCAVK